MCPPNRYSARCARRRGVAAQLPKLVTSHVFRHSLVTHLLRAGDDLHTAQALLGHADVGATMIDTHVLNKGGRGILSPLDTL